MIFPAKMKKIELLIFKSDADAVLEYLGVEKCFHASRKDGDGPSETRRRLEALAGKLGGLREFLAARTEKKDAKDSGAYRGWGKDFEDEKRPRLPGKEDIDLAEKIIAEAAPLVEEEKTLTAKRQKTLNVLDEASAFAKLDLPLRDMEAVTFISCRMGFVSPAAIDGLRAALGNRALVLQLDAAGRIFAVSSKKGRFALDTELEKVGFRGESISDELRGLPPDAHNALQAQLAQTDALLRDLAERKAALAGRYGEFLRGFAAGLETGAAVEELKESLLSTETACVLSGWIPAADEKKILAGLEAVTRGRIAARSWVAEEVEAVREGREKIPVKLQHGKFLQSFAGIVVSYGSPLYGTVDPTAIVSFFFVLLFAVMFGDVGQGFVGVLAGFVLASGKIRALRNWQKFAPVFKSVGFACMVTGFLYGSVFCDEHLLVPATRFISLRISGVEMDRFVTLLPGHGIGKTIAFFGFTIGIGVLVNSIGLLINIYNRFKLKDYRAAIFGKTGLTGAFLFWYAIFMAVRLGLGAAFGLLDAVFLGLPLFVLFWGEPLYRIAVRERPLFPEGIFSFVMEGCVEVMETVSYFISNSVSFLRVGAFALSHAVLSLIIFTLADLMTSLPAGILLRILIIVAGNALIIALEGLIVSIQVIRLQYYEFFSKFFTEPGEPFKPFELGSAGKHKQRESV